MDWLQKSLKNPGKALRYLAYRVLAVFLGHRDYRKFIVLARSRTGSNLLLSYLNSHPRIFAQGEVFQKLHGRDPKKILASVFGRQPRYIRAVGFKIFYYHPLDGENCPLWQELAGMSDLGVIHLKRRNIMKTLLSRKMAARDHAWQCVSTPEPAEKKPAFAIDSEELRQGFVRTREWETNAGKMFAAHRLIDLYYEDLVADPQAAFKRVTDFLGLPYRLPKSKLRKQNLLSLREMLINYDQLQAEFSGSEWESFFDE